MKEHWESLGVVRAASFAVILAVAFDGISGQTKTPEQITNNVGNKMNQKIGFYCNAKALTKAERERYNQLTGKLAQARAEVKELADGYAFRLKGEEVSLLDLGEWISAERKCCPFFSFEVEVQRDSGPLWLKLRGAEGIKPFIRAEFAIPLKKTM
jgi:hypothetical protein